jgi:AcrR family transcriptional regulator
MTGQERRQQLLDIGRRLFAERGFEGTSIEEIAAQAGVSKPVVYEHFGGKEGLYAVVVDREVERLSTMATTLLEGEHSRPKFEAAAVTLLRYIEDNADGFRILVRDAHPGSGGGTFGTLLSDIAGQVEYIMADFLVSRGRDPKLAPMYSQMLVGMVAFTGQWWLDARKPKLEQVAANMIDLAWNGLSQLDAQALSAPWAGARPPGQARAAGRMPAVAAPARTSRALPHHAGHLEGEPAAGREQAGPADQQVMVAGHPLQHGIADQHVRRTSGPPVPDIAERERKAADARRGGRPGGGDHLRRVIHAGHLGGRPPPGERRGQVARAAAEVGHVPRAGGADPRQQVEERPRPLAAEPQVLPSVPHGEHPSSCGTTPIRSSILTSRDMLCPWGSFPTRSTSS